MLKPNYVIFIDDSGYKQYINPYDITFVEHPEEATRDYWLKNYFIIAGIIINKNDIPKINREINYLKNNCFKRLDVEIKSTYLRYPSEMKKHYIDKYNINKIDLDLFVSNLYKIFNKYKNEIKIISCIYDKRYYKFRDNHDPLCETFQCMFERIEYFLSKENEKCILVVDQMEDSLSPERGKNGELKDVLLNRKKMEHVFVEKYTSIENINFSKSKDENFLQLADIVAYNIFRQFVDYGIDWEKVKKELPTYEYFRYLINNFITKKKQLRGISITKLPDPKKINWCK